MFLTNDQKAEPLKTFDGKPITDGQTALTLRDVCIQALTNSDAQQPATDKVRCFVLAEKIYKAEDTELTAEDVTCLKERIGKIYSALVVGQSYRVLDPASVK